MTRFPEKYSTPSLIPVSKGQASGWTAQCSSGQQASSGPPPSCSQGFLPSPPTDAPDVLVLPDENEERGFLNPP